MRVRFTVWNKWRKKSLNSKWHKLLVLLGLRHSPTFEIELVWSRVNHTINEGLVNAAKSISESAARAGITLEEFANYAKRYSEDDDEGNIANKHQD